MGLYEFRVIDKFTGGNHNRIESFYMSYLDNCIIFFTQSNKLICLFNRFGYRFLNED